jgi:thiamine biosynthesis protein ThiS
MKVNGAIEAAEAATVAELLRLHGIGPWTKFVAVAVNGAVVRREAWETTTLGPRDEVDIIKPRQGG